MKNGWVAHELWEEWEEWEVTGGTKYPPGCDRMRRHAQARL